MSQKDEEMEVDSSNDQPEESVEEQTMDADDPSPEPADNGEDDDYADDAAPEPAAKKAKVESEFPSYKFFDDEIQSISFSRSGRILQQVFEIIAENRNLGQMSYRWGCRRSAS